MNRAQTYIKMVLCIDTYLFIIKLQRESKYSKLNFPYQYLIYRTEDWRKSGVNLFKAVSRYKGLNF